MSITRRTIMLASAGTLAMPWVARAAETLRFGVTSPITGPAAESGGFQQTGVKLAVDEVNEKGVLGKKLEFVVDDDQTTNPGAVLAFSRLSGDPAMVGFIGSVRSTQVNAMAPDVLKIGKPMMIGGTDPALTHTGNRWLFRCRPNDSYSAKVIFAYGDETLAKKKWAIVHSTDAFGTGGMKAFTGSLKDGGHRAGAGAGLHQPAGRLHAGGAGGAAVGRGHPVQLLHVRDRRRRVRPPAAPAGRARPLDGLAFHHQHLRAEPRRAAPVRHVRRRRLRRRRQRRVQGVRREVPGGAQDAAGQPVLLDVRRHQYPGARDQRRRQHRPGEDPHRHPRRSRAMPGRRASTISTPTATGCTATTW